MNPARPLICLLLTALFALPASADDTFAQVRFETTAGTFVVEVDGNRAPLTVGNFLGYARNGFYEGTIFHRVVQGFVVQGGGFTSDYSEKPTGMPLINESGNGLSNRRGSIAMARTNEPHSATSQFYINLADNDVLDPRPSRWGYTVFGYVIEGMEVIDDIGNRATGPGGPFDAEVPASPIIIMKVEVITAGGATKAEEPAGDQPAG